MIGLLCAYHVLARTFNLVLLCLIRKGVEICSVQSRIYGAFGVSREQVATRVRYTTQMRKKKIDKHLESRKGVDVVKHRQREREKVLHGRSAGSRAGYCNFY